MTDAPEIGERRVLQLMLAGFGLSFSMCPFPWGWFRLFGKGLGFKWMPSGQDWRTFSERYGYRWNVKMGRLSISALPALEPPDA